MVSYKNIKEVEKISKQDRAELQNKMGCDPADPETLLSWRFIPSLEDDKNDQYGKDIENFYRGLRDYLLKREGAIFKKSEAGKIQEKPKASKENQDSQAGEGEQWKYEEFVRKLRVWVECDTDINFRPFKRQKKTFSHAAMGFHFSTSCQWRALREIIEDGEFSCGEAAYLGKGKTRDRVKFYDQRQKLLQIINKKLLAFLTKTYKIEFRKKYKIFEQLPEDTPGFIDLNFKRININVTVI